MLSTQKNVLNHTTLGHNNTVDSGLCAYCKNCKKYAPNSPLRLKIRENQPRPSKLCPLTAIAQILPTKLKLASFNELHGHGSVVVYIPRELSKTFW